MKSREHVTTNGRAVFFAATWEDLRQAALSHGWALGLHGSLSSDMDIMAMPWDEHASTPEVMINQLCICFTEGAQIEKNIRISTDKPNNRTVYTLPIWADFYLDINVISAPLATDNTLPAQTMKEEVRELADQVLKMLPPEGAEEVLSKVIIENAGNSAFSFGDNHMEIFNTLHTCFDPEPARRKVLKAMQEYAQQSREQERQKVIQECIDIANKAELKGNTLGILVHQLYNLKNSKS